MVNGMVIKGKQIIITPQLQMQMSEQLHSNHMGVEKTKLLACESIYWLNINADIDVTQRIYMHKIFMLRVALCRTYGSVKLCIVSFLNVILSVSYFVFVSCINL